MNLQFSRKKCVKSKKSLNLVKMLLHSTSLGHSLLSRFLTESITGLIVNGIFSSTIMIAVGIAYLYLVISNPEVDSIVRPIVTFASRSLSFALLWAPILILNLITRPQYWKT